MPAESALSKYGQLGSRTVDLVGDYAGQELFLIDGDSLLLHCFSDQSLDFDHGLQLLHLTYKVESFLQNLLDRRARFEIVWFESNQKLCIPLKASEEGTTYKYMFARQVVINHLDHLNRHPTDPLKQIGIHKFEAPDSTAALGFYASSGTYFVMCHDGAKENGSTDPSDELVQQQKTQLRSMILSFVDNGVGVALINEVAFRDTKVMTQVLERTRGEPKPATSNGIEPVATESITQLQGSQESQEITDDDKSLLEHLAKLGGSAQNRLVKSQRTFLLCRAGKALSKENSDYHEFVAAVLLHAVLLHALPLSARSLPAREMSDSESEDSSEDDETEMTQKLLHAVYKSLRSTSGALGQLDCDIADLFDGRLLHYVLHQHSAINLPASLQSLYQGLCTIAKVSALRTSNADSSTKAAKPNVAENPNDLVLPFSNEHFDSHLAEIKLEVTNKEPKPSPTASRIFQDLTHWHNAQRSLNKRAIHSDLDGRARRRNQLYLSEMTAYAASLTNAVGKSLDPEIIAADTTKDSNVSGQKQLDIRSKPGASKPPAKGAKPKMKPAEAAKLALFEKEQKTREAKQDKAVDQNFQAWKLTRARFDATGDAQKRYLAADAYFTGLSSQTNQAEKRALLEAEIKLYQVWALLSEAASPKSQTDTRFSTNILALVVNVLRDISKLPNLTAAEAMAASKIAKRINMPLSLVSASTAKRALSFDIDIPKDTPSITQDWKEFQLLHCGPYMDRALDATEDDRVPFRPDAWQRDVLDELDRDNSVFVVAPTSAGKTFISFYAMRKILAAEDDILVYLAPTKALVNQIAAEVQARFKKQYKYAGKSVWAIHTRDHRINNPSGCQILVTVPHVLQIMLLAPENAKTWAPRVKRIIFDEIHCIGQAEDGLVWEQLLLLAPCPIIALSATVGNSKEFSSWMSSTQEALGNKLVKIEHKSRYSDLRKFIYNPPKTWTFTGIPPPRSAIQVGIEDPATFSFVHPVACLGNRSRGIPEDFSLEARDCLTLFRAMESVQTPEYPIDKSLGPQALLENLAKADILQWEEKLKKILADWLKDLASPFDKLVAELGAPLKDRKRQESLSAVPDKAMIPASLAQSSQLPHPDEFQGLERTTLPLLISLEQQRALPAILFNYDRGMCEDICQHLVNQLKETEDQAKQLPAWTKKIAEFEQWKARKEAAAKKGPKIAKKGAKNEQDSGMSKLDRAMLEGAEEVSEFESFDPDAPLEAFSFADKKKMQADEVNAYTDRLRWRKVPEWLIEALGRGLGVHHAGMNRLYRQTVEVLFRKGYLRVVIATGTLALGINMPCKTVVFSGDSVFLTALNFRQAAGRAGRRGFDLLGNVVFHGLSLDKVYRLVSSRLPDLNGHFPITTTLVLRLFSLLHNSDTAPYARQAVKALLSQPRVYLGAAAFKQQVLHHLRFSIDYLRREDLLEANGAPINFAGTVSHLYYTENSAFAFHVLLKNGYFHDLAKAWRKNNEAGMLKLMLVLSHIFGRQICKVSDRDYKAKDLKMSSSMVFLPELPKEARAMLEEHNDHTRRIFTTYVRTFAQQHLQEEEQRLPLSNLDFRGSDEEPRIDSLPPPTVRSAFAALSGSGDEFESVGELCDNVRSGVFLEKAVVPQLEIYPDASGRHLNAYLYDYYRNCDVRALREDNGIRRADVWFMLNDFSLAMATIIADMNNYLRATPMSELDMLDIKGGGDAGEIAKDDEMAAQETAEETQERLTKAKNVAAEAPKQVKRKKKVADSWDDEDEESSEEGSENEDFEGSTAAGTYGETASTATALGDETGLRAVLNMFKALQVDFNTKFRAMWA